jgi:hypothetical protein
VAINLAGISFFEWLVLYASKFPAVGIILVSARGNERRTIFRDERDRKHFLDFVYHVMNRGTDARRFSPISRIGGAC